LNNLIGNTQWLSAIINSGLHRAARVKLICLATLLALVITSVSRISGLARPDAVSLLLDPTPTILAGCGTVEVDIRINDVVNLYGADVKISFDPALLEVVDADSVETGVQILPVSELLYPDWVIRNTVDNTLGTIWYAATQLNPRPPSSGSGAIATITFRAKAAGTSALTFTYSKLAALGGVEITPVTRTNGSVQTSGPSAPALSIARLNSTTARLTWGSVAGVTNYHLYRDTTPYFTPVDPAYYISSGLSYNDVGALGDTVVQHYYTMRSACANGLKSNISNRVGEYDWELRSDTSTNYNDISMVLGNSALPDAKSLAAYIGSSAKFVLRFLPDSQYFDSYVVGYDFTNFSITTGQFLYIITDNTAPASFALVGDVPAAGSVSFDLYSGATAQYNFISLPLDHSNLTNASQVVADVGSGVVALIAFRSDGQYFDSYIPGYPFTDFDIVPGEPFCLILTTGAPIIWP
jgi:hypothetical protein